MTEPALPVAIAAGYGEAERQAAELAAMRRMLDASRGCFSLSVAVCNSPALRDQIVGELCHASPGIRVISVPRGTIDVFGLVNTDQPDSHPAALLLTNLDASLPSERDSHPTLRSLNASRERWPRRFPCPVVFWLPEYAATLLSTHARDFWRYRSHSFEFVSEQAGAVTAMTQPIPVDFTAAANLSREEKRFRIAELEQRIADAREAPADALGHHVPLWLNELGFLYVFLGDLDRAERIQHQALNTAENLGRTEGMAYAYGNLGAISLQRGDLDEAEKMVGKALSIYEKLGRVEASATAYGNLGVICETRGDLEQAERMHRKALAIDKRLGRMVQAARHYANLGIVYRKRGDLPRAEEMQRKALEINETLGRVEGIASACGNLGVIYLTRGDLDRAQQMLRKTMEIDERLGRMEGVANACGNLGLICQMRGDLDRADQMLHRALDLYEKLGGREGAANQIGNLASIAADRGDVDMARELWARALDIFRRIGATHRVEQTQRLLDGLPRQS